MIQKIKFLVLTIVFFNTFLISHAKGNDIFIDGKYYALLAQDRYTIKKDKAKTSAANSNNKDKQALEEEKDPINNYRLVAIYLISEKPRALIKSDLESNQGAIEYGIGDYIDEEQTISISKILFTPTARIELKNESGLTYLMKPYAIEDKGTKSTYSGTSTFPTYSSDSESKSKKKEKDKDKKKKDKKDETDQGQGKDDSASSSLEAAIQGDVSGVQGEAQSQVETQPQTETQSQTQPQAQTQTADQAGSTPSSLEAASGTEEKEKSTPKEEKKEEKKESEQVAPAQDAGSEDPFGSSRPDGGRAGDPFTN